ncbi:MAG: kelch repeat-containing protein [Proteiniphilum sp.]|nr:kelch repeat-containing protein [Proteiniphilum sp.]
MNILLFSSCLNSSDSIIEYPTDPQIYAISVSSRTDTASLLSGVVFTIDQVKGEIFNREPLPYLFKVDSATLNLTASNSYYSFFRIDLRLDDSDDYYTWKGDSIAINRLREIKTTAPDGVTAKNYKFQLNIYQNDPDSISWEKIKEKDPTPPAASQKTVAHNNLFFTYYRSGTEMKAVSSSDGKNWSGVNLSGMPHTVTLSSLITSGNAIYALDTASGSVYRSSNGAAWNLLQTNYKVAALYGELPFASPGNILLAVKDVGNLKFARAGNDLSVITPMNDIPAGMPVTDFSAIKVESSSSYASKFIFLSGGTKVDNTPNEDIWVIQEDEGVIKYIKSKRPTEATLKGSSLFFYDDKPWMIVTSSAGKNLLMYSENYGVDWIEAGENQVLPDDFTGRTNASVITDTDNYIWIFGGISSSDNTPFADVWKGRLNKFGSV